MVGETCTTNDRGETLSRVVIDPPQACIACERAALWRFYAADSTTTLDLGSFCSIRCCLDRLRHRRARDARKARRR